MPLPSEWSLVVCGGGSGGHLFPPLAVIEELRRRRLAPARILFLTAERSIESAILKEQGIEQVPLPAVESQQFRRKPISALRTLGKGVRQAVGIIRTLPAPVILGTGGFGSVPGVLAGRWRKRPIILLEQNLIPGRATSWLARFAKTVCLSFSETGRFLPEQIPIQVTGNPVRQSIAFLQASSVISKKRLLVLGGSQGAAAINEALIRYAGQHREQLAGWTILHQTGEADCARIQNAYHEMKQKAEVAPFFDNMLEQYERASIVVTRAGGTSLAEIACAGLPTVIVPYPKSLRNHQLINARHFLGRNAAFLVEQGPAARFDAELASAITLLIEDKTRRKTMAVAMKACAVPEAAGQVCEILLKILRDF